MISASSRVPLPSSSQPMSMRSPPCSQLSPGGSSVATTTLSGVVQTKLVESISSASRTPSPLSSAPVSMRCPPSGQFSPTPSSATLTRVAAPPPSVPSAPALPLHTKLVVSTSSSPRAPSLSRSSPDATLWPPNSQLSPAASSPMDTSPLAPLVPSAPSSPLHDPVRAASAALAMKMIERIRSFMLLQGLGASARRHRRARGFGFPLGASPCRGGTMPEIQRLSRTYRCRIGPEPDAGTSSAARVGLGGVAFDGARRHQHARRSARNVCCRWGCWGEDLQTSEASGSSAAPVASRADRAPPRSTVRFPAGSRLSSRQIVVLTRPRSTRRGFPNSISEPLHPRPTPNGRECQLSWLISASTSGQNCRRTKFAPGGWRGSGPSPAESGSGHA